ncbi:hypothetical protein [Latilactobacillus curvatus]|uniref:hypothetical protein n=2 Tax=Latilactobacillus curvatus TaxID=28038 RepID=UPI0021A7262A|nr:hypothetical protein [Latilactobacillus curvatus]MCT3527704.1 hypothetical protein [Latilactobacillus curvatus]MDG2987284.1 hypothetical protein [Latilactobacillus curvatus]
MLILDSLFDFAFSEVLTGLKDKKREIKILSDLKANIQSFDENFNDTELDTNTFEKYLCENPLVSSYFSKVFILGQEHDSDTLDKIISDVINKINAKRISQRISPFTNRVIVEDYFRHLSAHIISERRRILGLESLLITAEIKDGLLSAINTLLEDQLTKPSNDNFKFTSQLLYNNNQTSIISLGERYSPKINIATIGNKPFEALFQTRTFQIALMNLYNEIIEHLDKYKDSNNNEQEWEDITQIETSEIASIDLIEKNVAKVATFLVENSDFQKELTDLQKHHFYNTKRALNEFEDFVAETKMKLWSSPFLIVTGDAAIGKSHLLADNVEKMEQLGHPIIFTLGQKFLPTKDPLQQIVENFGYTISVEEFLYQFDMFSEKRGKRGCIIIDALNETGLNRFWKTQLQSMVSKIKKYKNIGIVFSIRSTYVKNILPENFTDQNDFQIYNHDGITTAEDNEIEKFEGYFGLDRGELLKIYPEFSSPLFLKLAAISSLMPNSTKKKLTWENLIDRYIKYIEKEISTEYRLNYDGKYLQSVIEYISHKMLKTHSNFLNYRETKSEIARKFDYDIKSSREYLDELIKENLFSKFTNFDGEEKIHFTYEKIRDFFIASNIISDFDQNAEAFGTVIQDELLANNEYGVIEILFFMLPNIKNAEITDFIEDKDDSYNLERSFIESVPWRIASLNSESIKDVLRNIFNSNNLMMEFLNKQFLLAIDSESPFNSEWLSRFLLPLSNDLRDYVWTTRISTRYHSFAIQFINRTKRNYMTYSCCQLNLALKQLIWLLSSVNGEVRDNATKVISLILIKKPDLTKDFLEYFKDVSDLYIRERLYAAAFGAIVKIEDYQVIESTAEFTYETIFHQDEVVPNVLLRDYARQSIEFALSKGLCEHIDQKLIAPPYKSRWYDFQFTNDDVDSCVKKYESIGSDEGNSVYRIRSSMTTEYGRGTGAYGDFGRYIFGSRVSPWSNQFNDQDLSNIAFKRILEIGFSPELHAYFDNTQASNYDRHNHSIERIGKKYQWIAYYEVLAKLADNFQIYEEKIFYDTEYQVYQEQYYDRLMSSLTSFDWDSDDGEEGAQNVTEEMNAEDHIIEIKKVNQRYFQGPFEDYMKNIDPTYNTELPDSRGKLLSYSQPPSLTEPNIFNVGKEFIECEYNGKKYINLNFRYSNEEDLRELKSASSVVGVAFFSKESDKDRIIRDNIKNYGQGVSAPSNVNVFLHELYWSPAYDYFENLYDEVGKLKEYAVYEYLWESNDDFSLNDGVSLYIPSKNLVDYFSLTSIDDGVWKDDNDEIVAFDGVVYGYEHSLWFDQVKLTEYMNKTKQKLFWRSWGSESIGSQFVEEWFLVEKEGANYKIYISKKYEGDRDR